MKLKGKKQGKKTITHFPTDIQLVVRVGGKDEAQHQE